MRKTLLVARWEFLTTIRRKAYIFSVIAMPLIYVGLAAIAAFAGRSATTNAGRIPTAIVDRAHVVDLKLAPRNPRGEVEASLFAADQPGCELRDVGHVADGGDTLARVLTNGISQFLVAPSRC